MGRLLGMCSAGGRRVRRSCLVPVIGRDGNGRMGWWVKDCQTKFGIFRCESGSMLCKVSRVSRLSVSLGTLDAQWVGIIGSGLAKTISGDSQAIRYWSSVHQSRIHILIQHELGQ